MRQSHVSCTIDAPADAAWRILIDVRRWPEWGPSVRSATVDGDGHEISSGATGTVTTAVGLTLPYRITAWEPARTWTWRVGSIPATSHTVRPLTDRRCEVSFGVPWVAAPYLAVCRIALGRIERSLTSVDRSAPRAHDEAGGRPDVI